VEMQQKTERQALFGYLVGENMKQTGQSATWTVPNYPPVRVANATGLGPQGIETFLSEASISEDVICGALQTKT